ncbi:MAG: branched-chain amino acid ABC transporter permease [Candidatus Omnitrophica bacterium]|nr:branched-chain amino acid ABC transporter permease [Candidatus Omnitrophota bacterium]
MTPLQLFLQQLANGLTLGSIYALIALGYTMVYGVIQLINFAHGEVFMVGAYAALIGLVFAGAHPVLSHAPWWILLAASGVAAMGVCSGLGWAIERVAYRPIRHAPRLNALITAIGMSFFLQNALMGLFGATDRQFPNLIPYVRWELGGVSVTFMQLVVWLAGAVLMVGLQVLVMSTKLGMAMRATAQDLKACALLGIPVHRIIATTFVIGSALAAIGGMLFGLHYGTINFHDGYLTGLKAFTAAVLGGIGNVPGAMVGGLLLGLLEALGAGYLSSQWKNVFAFLILVVLLLCKPTGLLGERVADRA